MSGEQEVHAAHGLLLWMSAILPAGRLMLFLGASLKPVPACCLVCWPWLLDWIMNVSENGVEVTTHAVLKTCSLQQRHGIKFREHHRDTDVSRSHYCER